MRVPPVLPPVLRVASRLRGARAFHPRDAVFEATWIPVHEIPALRGTPLGEESCRALVRLSHGVGMPVRLAGRRIPEAVGEALRFDPWHTGAQSEPSG